MAREGAFCTSGPPHEVASGIVTQRASHSEIVVGLMASVSLAVRASATAGNGVLERLGVGGWWWRLRAPVALRRTSNNAVAGKKTPEMVRAARRSGCTTDETIRWRGRQNLFRRRRGTASSC